MTDATTQDIKFEATAKAIHHDNGTFSVAITTFINGELHGTVTYGPLTMDEARDYCKQYEMYQALKNLLARS
jgi:hypothetical protein